MVGAGRLSRSEAEPSRFTGLPTTSAFTQRSDRFVGVFRPSPISVQPDVYPFGLRILFQQLRALLVHPRRDLKRLQVERPPFRVI